MREIFTYGPVGGLAGKPAGSTRTIPSHELAYAITPQSGAVQLGFCSSMHTRFAASNTTAVIMEVYVIVIGQQRHRHG